MCPGVVSQHPVDLAPLCLKRREDRGSPTNQNQRASGGYLGSDFETKAFVPSFHGESVTVGHFGARGLTIAPKVLGFQGLA